LVVYHLHGQTGRITVWANGKGLVNSVQSRLALAICTNQSHLPKNDGESLKLVSKMGLKEWNTNFRLEHSDWETGLPFQTFRFFLKFSTGTTRKVVFHFLSNRISNRKPQLKRFNGNAYH